MKSLIKSRLPFLFRLLRHLNLLKQAYFSKYGRIPGAINYPLSVISQRSEIAARRNRADALLMPSELSDKLRALRTDGFCKLKLSDIVTGGEAAAFLDALRGAAAEFGTPTHADLLAKLDVRKTKSYFYDIANSNPGIRAEIVNFARSPKAIALAAKYLGQMPLIENVAYIYSPPTHGAELIAAQGWHLDREQKSKLKIFLSPFRVSAASGPTTLLPLKHSVGQRYPNFPGYFDDAEGIAAGVRVDQKVHLFNEVGELYMADTSKLFHYGARHQTEPRFLVIISYCPLESRLRSELRKQVKDNSIDYGWQA